MSRDLRHTQDGQKHDKVQLMRQVEVGSSASLIPGFQESHAGSVLEAETNRPELEIVPSLHLSKGPNVRFVGSYTGGMKTLL